MPVKHEVRLRKALKKLDKDEKPDREAVSAFPSVVGPDDLTVTELMDCRKLGIPAAMITIGGKPAWLIVRYVGEDGTLFFSKTEGDLVTVDALEGKVRDPEGEEFTLGGWQHPLKAITAVWNKKGEIL